MSAAYCAECGHADLALVRSCTKYAGGGYFIRPSASPETPSPGLHAPEVREFLLAAVESAEKALYEEQAGRAKDVADLSATYFSACAERDELRALLQQVFAELTDDAQAQFLCIAAGVLGEVPGVIDRQGWRIGRHLTTCECSTEAGREFVRSIATGMGSHL